jgi:DNA-binding MarR family transcriptional regulator
MATRGQQPSFRGRAALERVDKLLEHRPRLAICVLLAQADALSFSRLKHLLAETDGNLGAQLRKLEEGGYVRVRKEFVERKPVSWYELTAAGRRALRDHLDAMSDLLKSVPIGGERT